MRQPRPGFDPVVARQLHHRGADREQGRADDTLLHGHADNSRAAEWRPPAAHDGSRARGKLFTWADTHRTRGGYTGTVGEELFMGPYATVTVITLSCDCLPVDNNYDNCIGAEIRHNSFIHEPGPRGIVCIAVYFPWRNTTSYKLLINNNENRFGNSTWPLSWLGQKINDCQHCHRNRDMIDDCKTDNKHVRDFFFLFYPTCVVSL